MDWDNIWKEKKYVTDFSLRWLDFLSGRRALLPAGAKVLEAGSGSGEGIASFAERGITAYGTDTSEEAIARTASHKNVTALKADNFALPFPDNTFDLVFNSGVIEHYDYPENIMQVKEMARVAKPGSEVIVNVPNSLCLWYVAGKKLSILFKKWRFGYEDSYTPARLKKTVEEAGLRAVGFTGFLSIPPFATDNRELLPLGLRKRLAWLERGLPFKQYYCYSVCALCRKG
jgi:ubiquinone/menaquinone biosynthesis C-methylase UbiE